MIVREPNTEYVLSLSYGKDSVACLEAIKILGYPLDRIVHAEVWATETISADLPPMVDFKRKADKIILERYGIKVEHCCATRERERELLTKISSIISVSHKSPRENGFTVSLTPSVHGVILALK